jgi:xylulokinase
VAAIFVIGCDVGTQSVRAAVVDETGTTIATASVALTVDHPHPGWAEQDPRAWRHGLATAVRRATADARVDRRSVVAMGIAAQVDTVVALDADGAPIGMAPIWMDRRATRETQELVNALGSDAIREISGLNADATHGAPKIRWLRRHAGGESFVPPAAFVVESLTGERVMDPANAASFMLWDLRRNDWSDQLLNAAAVPADALPAVRPSTDVAGRLRVDAAEELGLSADCVVAVGTGDEHAAFVGAGALASDIVGDVAGTAEPVGASATQPISDPDGLLETHPHAVPGRWLIENPGFVSGGSVRWLADVLGSSQADVFESAGDATEGAAGALFLPALSGSVTPRWDAFARGSFSGLTLSHGRAELGRALIEGCAFAVRDSVERLHALQLGQRALRAVGGGARVPLWLQIKADVTKLPVEVPRETEATSRGAALIAAVAANWHADLDDAAAAMVGKPAVVVEPRGEFAALYDDAYARYRQLFDALQPTFQRSEPSA